ncbi:MAG TPA: TolC family protein [Polyangia bacterium]|nr:TolC family protein [Polyangia bacterium]
MRGPVVAGAVVLALALTPALALIPALARAEAATAEPRPLTMEEALAMAKRANKNLVVERARLAQAHTNIEQAWSALFPVVTAQGKYTRNYKNATLDFGALLMGLGFTPTPGASNGSYDITILKQDQFDANVSATMPLIAPAAYPALDAVKKGYGSSEADYEASEDTVLYSVAQTFYSAAVSDEVLVVRESAIKVAQATLDNAQSRFSAGTVTKVDVDRAELALVRAKQGELDARYAQEQSYRALATLIQADGPVKAAPPETLSPPGETDLDMALHLRPEFRGLILSQESSDAQRRAYGWRWAPTLSAFAKANIGNYVGFTGDNYAWSVGAQLDWTLFDGGARDAQRHLAAAQAAQAAAQAAVLTDSIRDDLANDRSLLETRREGVKAAQRGADLAAETLDLVRSQYEAGTVTQIDLLQAQDNLVIAQESLASARFDAAIADLALRRAAGTFPPR